MDMGGNVYVADNLNNRVQVFSPDGIYLTQWGTYGSGDGQFSGPFGVAVDAGGRVYVADTYNHRIQVFEGDGTYVTQWGALRQRRRPVQQADGRGGERGRRRLRRGLPEPPHPGLHRRRRLRHPVGRARERRRAVRLPGGRGGLDQRVRLRRRQPEPPRPGVHRRRALPQEVGRATAPATGSSARRRAWRWTPAARSTWRTGTTTASRCSAPAASTSPAGARAAASSGQFNRPLFLALDAGDNVFVVDTRNHRVQVFGSLPVSATATTWGRIKTLYR